MTNTFSSLSAQADTSQMTAEQLLAHVRAQNGVVSASDAQRFVNIILYGAAEETKAIADLKAEGSTILINLYSSIAKRQEPGDLRYLDLMNNELGLDLTFRTHFNFRAAAFAQGENLDKLAAQWAAQIPAPEQANLKVLLAAMTNAGGQAVDNATKLAVYNFIATEFCKQVGGSDTKLRVEFYEDTNINAQGYFKMEDGVPVQRINILSSGFQTDGLAVIDTVVHEATHCLQMALITQYKAGEIKEGHQYYDAARLYNAQFEAYVSTKMGQASAVSEAFKAGQLSPEEAQAMMNYLQATHASYEAQNIEQAARESGALVAGGVQGWINGTGANTAIAIVGAKMGNNSTMSNGQVAAQVNDIAAQQIAA